MMSLVEALRSGMDDRGPLMVPRIAGEFWAGTFDGKDGPEAHLETASRDREEAVQKTDAMRLEQMGSASFLGVRRFFFVELAPTERMETHAFDAKTSEVEEVA